MLFLLVGGASALVSFALLAALRPFLARRAVDLPTARSSHSMPTPRAGGLGVVVAAGSGAVLAAILGHGVDPTVLSVLVAMALVGAMEDFHGLPIRARIVAQALVAGVATASMDPGRIAPLLLPVIVFGLVAYCNAFNFMDGINGLSGLSALLALGWYVGLGVQVEADAAVMVSICLAGGVLGFLPWNLPRARLFLGDTGSYALGMALGVLALVLWLDGAHLWAVVAPMVIYAADVSWTLARRVARGEAWHQAHRDHVYQQLSLKLGHLPTAVLVVGYSALCCAAWWSFRASLPLVAGAWVLLVAAYLAQVRWWPTAPDRQRG